MKRAAQERHRAKTTRLKHLHLAHRDQLLSGRVDCVCDIQVNRFRKGQKQMGCGKPRCFICHSEKLFNRPRALEKRARASTLDGLKELTQSG